MVRQKDHLDFIAEAERLSVGKLRVELEKTKVSTAINHRENVVADKQVIADALLRFESGVTSLPPEDQKELVPLISREISVKHFDPPAHSIGSPLVQRTSSASTLGLRQSGVAA